MAQLARVADHRLALRETSGQGDERKLVDRKRHLFAADLGSRQRRRESTDRAPGLSAGCPALLYLQLGAHTSEDLQQPGSSRVQPNAVELELATRHQQRP